MNNELNQLKSMKTHSIIGIVLLFTLIGMIVSVIFAIIDGINILSTEWSCEKLEKQKILWGILTFVLLGNIASLVFAIKGISLCKKEQTQQQQQ